MPNAIKGTGMTVFAGGQTAGYIDLAARISDKLPQMILIVVALSFVVLLVAFRSLLLPLKAAAANLLSVGAAYGVVTFVFQEGHGAELIGLDGAVPIASYVPLLMFAILFGLSMDYEVFLLTQIQEHYKKDDDPHKAVVDGLASTGRVITSAALIMVCVFSSFVLNGNAVVKQFGVGLGGGDRDRRDDRALPRRARGDDPDGPRGVVAAELARPRSCRRSASRAATSSSAATPSSARRGRARRQRLKPQVTRPPDRPARDRRGVRADRADVGRPARALRAERVRPQLLRRPRRRPRARSPARASGRAPPRGRSPPPPRS